MKIYQPIQELQVFGIVTAGISLRHGGVSRAPYTSLNLGAHVKDDPNAVETNRKILFQETGLTHLRSCRQIHSASVVHINDESQPLAEHIPEADALVTSQHNIALGIFTADCIPIFVLDVDTPAIGIVHAGWRGTFARIARKRYYAHENPLRHTRKKLPNPFRTLHPKVLLYRQHRTTHPIYSGIWQHRSQRHKPKSTNR